MVAAGSTHMAGRLDGTGDTLLGLVCGAGVPANHHNWYVLVPPERGQLRARLAHVNV